MSILYGIPLSTFTRKVRLALAEKAVPYELKPVAMGRQSAELKALHPLGQVPVYCHQGNVIPDSTVIIAYLERVWPAAALWPVEPGELARALFIEEYADTRLREGIAPIFYEQTLKRLFQKKPADTAVVARAMAIVGECADYLESLTGEGPFLVGERLSVADIAVAAQFITLKQGLVEVDAARWPGLAAYLDALYRRPLFAGMMTEEAALLAAGRMS